jgi:hypothetical protein
MQVGADVLATNVVPMVVRAFEDPDARMQEEVLKRTLTLTKQLDFTVSPLNFCQVFQILELIGYGPKHLYPGEEEKLSVTLFFLPFFFMSRVSAISEIFQLKGCLSSLSSSGTEGIYSASCSRVGSKDHNGCSAFLSLSSFILFQVFDLIQGVLAFQIPKHWGM